MSAFSGILSLSDGPIDRSLIESLAVPAAGNRIDALDYWEQEGIRLAFAAAAVTPESLNETQPLVDSSSGCVILFDGRLDNRADLHSSLTGYDELLDRKSDAAFALAAWQRWGNDFLQHLLGDFALAIWNPRPGQLLLARDPLGQRPLFYSHPPDRFIFASTIEQLLQSRLISRELDEEALPLYLYWYGALQTQTPYRSISSLPGGHFLLVDREGLQVKRFWRLADEPPEPRSLQDDDVQEFRALFAEAVRCRLRSHTSVGLLLSGGLDSSSIACMAGSLREENGSPPVHAYTFAFDRFESCDERRYVHSTIACYGLAHTPVLADENWTLSTLEPWLSVFSEPYFSPYDALFYNTLERARADGMLAMLMGHGGDTLLDGSPRYLAEWLLARRWRDVHRQVSAYSAATKRPYPIGFVGNAITPFFPVWAREMIEYRHWPHHSFVPRWVQERKLDERPKLYRGKNAWWHVWLDQLGFGQTPHEAHLDRLMRRFGMEVRQPFLDVRLVEFLVRLPPEAGYFNGKRRHILRASLHDLLPHTIRDRDDKASFRPLLEYGLQRRRKFIEALIQDSELARRGYVIDRAWRHAIQKYLDGKTPPYSIYWNGLALEMWLRIRSGRLPPLEA